MKKSNVKVLSILIALSFLAALLLEAQGPRRRPPGQQKRNMIVLYHQAPDEGERLTVESMGGRVKRQFKIIPAMSVELPEAAIQALARQPQVRLIEPDYTVFADAIPNDPRFDELWGLNNTGQSSGTPGADISAVEAWDITTGSSSVLVGVIDEGIQITHPDLAANIWVNPGEIAGNGIDDDGNGFIDDINGWDFFNNDNSVFDGPSDDHGTHVAGTIGAVGNNSTGVTGVNWNVTIMSLKFLGPTGGSTADAISAIEYAQDKGVPVTSNSWGGGGFSQALKDAIDACNCVFVAAAGNDGQNTDVTPHYPSSYTSSNVISVASTTRTDARSSFSNFGATSVDLGAPGSSILSTVPTNTYGLKSGTSMATPHVSGVVALLLANDPSLTTAQLKSAILDNVDLISSMSGITVTGGRLNAAAALGAAPPPPPPPPPSCPAGSIDFNTFGLEAYSNQDGSGSVVVEDGGETLFMTGNRWRRSTQSFAVTADTVIQFEYSSTSQGEIHGIGFDEDQTLTNNTRIFQFWGTQNWGGAFQFSPRYSGSGNFESFSIPVGQSYTGGSMRLVFVNDKDSGAGTNTGRFRCVQILDGGGPPPPPPAAIYEEDFDDGSAQGWTKTGGGTDLWRVASDCVAAASGSFTIAFSRAAPNCDYDVGTAVGTATSPVIDSSGASSATLTFNHFWETESFSGAFDRMFIEVSTNGGGSWTLLREINSATANPSGFIGESFNVTPSSQFQLRFRFDSEDGQFNNFLGWYIDDIVLSGQ